MRALAIVFATVLALGALGLAVVFSGAYNVAATAPHSSAGAWLLQQLKQRSIRAHARDVAVRANDGPRPASSGFSEYDAMCATCHGAPGGRRSPAGEGLTPRPPDLARAAAQWSDAELFWVVKNGIKLAGMPAFGPTHSDDELWSIVAFVRRLPELSPEGYEALRREARPHEHGAGGHAH